MGKKPKPSTEPSGLLLRQAAQLFEDEAERKAFVDAVMAGSSKEQAIIALKDAPEIKTFPKLRPTEWQPDWVVRIRDDFRPGKHPLHDKGAFYVLDFSSIFSASAMLAIAEPPRTVLDMCASPGGKAVFAYRAFAPETLFANEALRRRAGILVQNLSRCGLERTIVGSSDPVYYSKNFPDAFELIVVDAPCSGQSLPAKGVEAPGCWSPQMVEACLNRQRRILANCAPCVAPAGHILYATCTYALKENERVVEWFLREHPEFEAVEVPHLQEFRSRYSDEPAYRIFPQQGLGAGAFVALLRRKGDRPAETFDFSETPSLWRSGQFVKPRINTPPPKPPTESKKQNRGRPPRKRR